MFETLAQLTTEWILPTVFFWLILCILATNFEEWIANLLASRGSHLRDAIRNMLGEAELVDRFYASPLIKSYRHRRRPVSPSSELRWLKPFTQPSPKSQYPEYIHPRLFAQITMSWVVESEPARSGRQKPATSATIHENVAKMKSTHPHLAEILEAMLSEFRQKDTSYHETFTGLQASLENWFNAVMEETTRLYRRVVQNRLLILGFMISMLANFDPVFLTTQLWNSSAAESGASTLPVGWQLTPLSEVDSCELFPGSGQQFGIPLPMSPLRDCMTPFSPSEDMNPLWKVTGFLVGGLLIRIGSTYVHDLLKSKAAPKTS